MLATLKKRFSAFAKHHFGNSKKGDNQLFCRQPWEFFTVNPEGDVYPCRCLLWSNKSIGNLLKQGPWQIWNSSQARQMRKSILDGTFRYCNTTCPYLEYRLLSSVDEIKNISHQRIIELKESALNRGPRVIVLAIDRTCNLYCEYCRNSQLSFDEASRRKAQRIQEQLLGDDFFKDAQLLLLGGPGEPLASTLYRGLLERFEFSKYPLLRVQLITNGLLFTPQFWQRINKNHGVIKTVSVSIDAACEATYLKSRRGGDFKVLLDNLRFISQLRSNACINQFEISFVVHRDNYREMKDFVALGKKLHCDFIKFTDLINFGAFSEEEYKQKAIHKKTHPENKDFVRYLDNSIFDDPCIKLRMPLREGLPQKSN